VPTVQEPEAVEVVDTHLETLEELTRLLLEEASLEELLAQVLELTARALRSSVAVSVTVVEDDGSYATVARSDDAAAAVDALQYELDEGPCVDALEQQQERYATDLATDQRWPSVAKRATEVGLRCVFAVPLAVNGEAIGALNIFGASPGGVTEDDRDLARRIAAPAATTLANARAYRRVSRLAGQLQEALESRAVIERAKGVIMAREGCDADDAFALLRKVSQDRNRKVRDVARAVVEGAPAGAGSAAERRRNGPDGPPVG
jgi:GAF domain-containing protein